MHARARADALLTGGHAVLVCLDPFSIRLTRPSGNGAIPTAPNGKNQRQNQKKKRKRKIARLRARDGSDCFYCGEVIPGGQVTIEHLLSQVDGGTDNPANLALAHAVCNEMAADLPVVEKVLLRERLRRKKAGRQTMDIAV